MNTNARFGLGALFLLLVSDVRPDDWAGRLIGRWNHEGRIIEFLGGGVGRDSDGGGRFFRFVTSDTSQLLIQRGGGAAETYVVQWVGDNLLLSAGGVTDAFSPAACTLSFCATNLLSLEAAKAVFLGDNPGALRVSLSELVPDYLATVPLGGSNCTYTLGPMHMKPSCSEHGALADSSGGSP